jgi:hypothetical protein
MDRRTPVLGSGMMTGVKVSETYPEAVAPEVEADGDVSMYAL